MRATVPTTSVGKVSAGRIDVGQIDAGPISIARLVLDSMHLDVSTGTATARNLSVEIDVAIALDWSVTVSIPFIGDFGWSDTIDFGTLSATIPFGDVTVPGVRALKIDVPEIAVSNLSAVVGAIRNLQLGPLVAEKIAARNVVAPEPDFTLSGLGLGTVVLGGASVPHAAVGEVTVVRMHVDALPLGTVTIPGLSLPRTAVGDIVSEGLDVSASSNPYRFPVDAGVISVTLWVTPSAEIKMDELRITNVAAAASLGAITLQDVVLPYDVMNLKLSELGIETIAVPTLEVS
jgi:hypothetical protein